MAELKAPLRKRVAVLGAGPAGLSAAYVLSKDPNVEVSVFEAEDQVGGLARSLELWEQYVDLGPHCFYSEDPRINQIWFEVMGDNYEWIEGKTSILFNNKKYSYPLSLTEVIRNFGFLKALSCGASFLEELFKIKTKNTPTFDKFVTSRFGKKLYELFFKNYSEKLWGIPCEKLDSDFASQRLRKLSFVNLILYAMGKEIRNLGKNFTKRFPHPKLGTGEFYERMSRKIIQAGGFIHLSRPVKGLWTDGSGVTLGIELVDGEFLGFDHVISTLPISKLIPSLKETPSEIKTAAQNLKFRNTVIVYVEVEGKDLFKDQWLYIYDSHVLTGRVTNFQNWSSEMRQGSQNTILAVEYWCNDKDAQWMHGDQEMVKLAENELRNLNLIGDRKILRSEVLRLPRCYPIYELGYKEHLSKIDSFVHSMKGLQVIGRYGAFKYNNQDHSILMGLLAAKNFLIEAQKHIWSIAADYDPASLDVTEESEEKLAA